MTSFLRHRLVAKYWLLDPVLVLVVAAQASFTVAPKEDLTEIEHLITFTKRRTVTPSSIKTVK